MSIIHVDFYHFDFMHCRNEKSSVEPNDEHEEGEIDDEDVHPMVKITKIDPKDIPEVSNKFLMRGNGSGTEAAKDEKEGNVKDKDKDKDRDRRKDKDKDRRDSGRKYGKPTTDDKDERSNFFFFISSSFGWSKRRVPLSRSGRAIKGRGVFVSRFFASSMNPPVKSIICRDIALHHVQEVVRVVLRRRIGNKHKNEPSSYPI